MPNGVIFMIRTPRHAESGERKVDHSFTRCGQARAAHDIQSQAPGTGRASGILSLRLRGDAQNMPREWEASSLPDNMFGKGLDRELNVIFNE